MDVTSDVRLGLTNRAGVLKESRPKRPSSSVSKQDAKYIVGPSCSIHSDWATKRTSDNPCVMKHRRQICVRFQRLITSSVAQRFSLIPGLKKYSVCACIRDLSHMKGRSRDPVESRQPEAYPLMFGNVRLPTAGYDRPRVPCSLM